MKITSTGLSVRTWGYVFCTSGFSGRIHDGGFRLAVLHSGQGDLPRPWASKLNPAHSEIYKLRGICCEGFSAGISFLLDL